MPMRFLHPAVIAATVGFLWSAPATAYTILAALEKNGNSASGPRERAGTFLANTAVNVSVADWTDFPPGANNISGSAYVHLASGMMGGEAHATVSGGHYSLRFVTLLEEGIHVDLPPSLPEAERFAMFSATVHAVGNA